MAEKHRKVKEESNMKFTIYGEGITVNESTKEEVEKRLSFLNKYFVVDESTSARINTRKYENALKVEVTIPTKIGLLRSEIVHEDLKTGIDLAIDKIEDQIRRNKSRLSRRHKDSLATSFYEENNNDIDIPVKTKTVYVEEMDLEEAIVQMEMLSHTFFVYKDSETRDVAIVYKRNDGNYGLLEVKD